MVGKEVARDHGGPGYCSGVDKAADGSMEMDLGQTLWLEPGQRATLKNRGNRDVQQLRIEFKTCPMKADHGVKDD